MEFVCLIKNMLLVGDDENIKIREFKIEGDNLILIFEKKCA